MVDGFGAFGEFFETDDGDAGGCGGPGVVLDELAADSVEGGRRIGLVDVYEDNR